MLKQKYFLTGIFILSAERQPIKLAWRKIVWLLYTYISPWNRRGSRIIELLHTYQLDNHLLDQKLCQSMLQLESNAIDRNTIIQTIIREQALARHFLLENIQS